MSVQPLPPRPNLDQLKRQAKELLEEWRAAPSIDGVPQRLRNAQRAIAVRYGSASWDALREHVERMEDAKAPLRRRGMQYDDPVPGAVELHGSITPDVARRLSGEHVTGVKIGPDVPAAGLVHLASIPTLAGIDLSGRDDISDADVAFLREMPWLEQVNMKWTRLGDAAIRFLAGHARLTRLIVGAGTTDAGLAALREIPGLAAPSGADSFLSISSARTLTDAGLEHVGSLQGVAALDVHTSVFGSPLYTARGAAHLARMRALQELNFHGNLATDAVLREFARIEGLRNLHCQDIVSGDEGFVALGQCEALESLGARTCVRLGTRGLAALARLPRLRGLSAGGPALTDDGWAPIAGAPALVDLNPIQSRDGAFEHIAKAPRLERLNNCYNRSCGDAATRHLRGHPRLTHYSAFGTQIGDETLGLLADLPRLERLEFENCAWITDDGLRALARAPRLERVSVWSCMRVTGAWLTAMPEGVDAKSEPPPPGQVEGYRAETLLDYPDMPIPPDVERLRGPDPLPGALASLVPFGVRAAWTGDGLELSLDPGIDPRWVSAMTEDALTVPSIVDLIVRPITMLKLGFGGHNRFVGFDEHGALLDLAPWFMKTEAQKGRRHGPPVAASIGSDDWVRVTLELQRHEVRLRLNGELRHTWEGDFSAFRGRIAVGLPRAGALTLREFRVTAT